MSWWVRVLKRVKVSVNVCRSISEIVLTFFIMHKHRAQVVSFLLKFRNSFSLFSSANMRNQLSGKANLKRTSLLIKWNFFIENYIKKVYLHFEEMFES